VAPVNIVQIAIIAVCSVLLFKTKIKSPWYIIVAILCGVLF
jgi:chromate transport protein ChrA